MGQRLVITIKDFTKRDGATELDNVYNDRDCGNIMKIYYHWGGYTNSAQAHLMEIARVIKQAKDEGKDIPLSIIKHVETEDKEATEYLSKRFPNQTFYCAGGIDGGKQGDEWKYITSLYPNEKFNDRPDRNNGLVSMSPEGMKQAQGWSEGDCIINVSTGECCNWTTWLYDSFDEWADSFCDTDKDRAEAKVRYDNAYTVDGDGEEVFNFNFNDEAEMKRVETVANKIFATNEGFYKDKYGRVYEMVL